MRFYCVKYERMKYMMKNRVRENRAITLIALVVTVIVLLVLAGVSISMLAGQNGVLTRAAEAKIKTDEANVQEKERMEEYDDTITQYNLPSTAEGQPKGTEIKRPSEYSKNVKAIADGNGNYFPLPEGAEYRGEGVVNKVNENDNVGVVVYIKESEFVWVPVDDAVLDKNDETKMVNLPKQASEWKGKASYTPMAVKVGENYKGILYSYSGSSACLKYNNSTNNYLGGSSDYREPDLVTSYDGGRLDTVNIPNENLQKQYDDMIESVVRYKGFYIARYEAGLENGNIVFKDASKENSSIITADASNPSTKAWYGLYSKIKGFTTAEYSVVSSMIWGSQYDAMMNWMAKSGTNVGSSISGYNSTTKTGSKDTDVINNIYDLYGCHKEWTLEAFQSKHRVKRGGSSGGGGSPDACEINIPIDTYSYYSSRATLYIK